MLSSVKTKILLLSLFVGYLFCTPFVLSNDIAQIDTTKLSNREQVDALVDSMRISSTKSTSFELYYRKAKNTAVKSSLEEVLYTSLDSLGVYFRKENKYRQALSFHLKASNIAEEIKNASYLAHCYNQIGMVYRQMDEFQPAINYHFKALRIAKEINDYQSMASALNNIGQIDFILGNYHSALKLLQNAYEEELVAGSEEGMATTLSNIGSVYLEMGKPDTAIEYFLRALDISKKINNKQLQAVFNDDIGTVYLVKGKYIEAIKYLLKALEINESFKDTRSIAENYLHIGQVFYHLDEPERAMQYAKECLEMAMITKSNHLISGCYELMSNIAAVGADYQAALEYYRQSVAYRDSVMNENNRQFMTRIQAEYESEKQQKDIRLLKNETEIAQLELERRIIINKVAVMGLILLAMLLAVIMWFNYNNWKKNKLLREKNEEIFKAQQNDKLNAERLYEAKVLAEEANRTKTLFLANISHEIRTPLNSIIGFTELISHHIKDEKQKNYLKSIKSSGRSLLSLINDILDLSKIEAGKLDVEYGPVDLNRIFNELKNIFSLKISQKNIDFKINVDPQIPANLILSESRLRQVLFNIVGNSLKFTEEGTVEISAMLIENKDPNFVDLNIQVKDTGIGIADEDQKRIFDAFNQTMSDSINQSEGTGLGLTISKRLVEIMNGKIEVESKLDEGSTFTIHLYDVEKNKGYMGTEESNALNYKQVVFNKATILVADDLDVNRELIKDMLNNSPLHILEAENGQEALQKAVRYSPDLVLMDIRMPVLNGIEAVKKMRDMVSVKDIPVIAVTAYSLLDEYQHLYERLFNGFMIKPVQINSLYGELMNFLPYHIEKSRDSDVEDDEGFKIDEEKIHDLHDLITRDIRLKWEEVNKTHFVNDILEFAFQVRELGKNKHSAILEEYGSVLISHTENFNIELMNETLDYFEKFIKTDQGHGSHEQE